MHKIKTIQYKNASGRNCFPIKRGLIIA